MQLALEACTLWPVMGKPLPKMPQGSQVFASQAPLCIFWKRVLTKELKICEVLGLHFLQRTHVNGFCFSCCFAQTKPALLNFFTPHSRHNSDAAPIPAGARALPFDITASTVFSGGNVFTRFVGRETKKGSLRVFFLWVGSHVSPRLPCWCACAWKHIPGQGGS